MTVALGLVCKDGVLVAADSMGSEELTAAKSQKVRVFGRTPALWTASGSVYVMEEVTEALKKLDAGGKPDAPLSAFTTPDLVGLRTQLKNSIHPAMSKAYASALSTVPVPPGHVHPSFVTNFVVVGYSAGTPWLLELAHDGQLNWHHERRFYATGSGGPFATVAMGLMSHYVTADLTLNEGKMLAYRTIETTIEVSNGLVGPPVQIATCDATGTEILTEDEIENVRTGVERWKTIERESLRMGTEAEQATGDLPVMGSEA